ncbi:MAG: PEP-CTERM sorting domain-containing protein [Planctomycetota bacterium]
MTISIRTLLAAVAATLGFAATAHATIPYTPVSIGPIGVGPVPALPSEVFGKEYSPDFDHTTAGAGGAPDAQQVVAWDGVGGATDSIDYTATRPTYTTDDQVDAIANHNDAFFRRLQNETAALIFTHDDEVFDPFTLAPTPIAPAGPVVLSSGNVIGGAGEVSIELGTAFAAPNTQSLWALQPEVNGMPLPRDVDGLEVWGPEPPAGADPGSFTGDADKYSLEVDWFSGTSIWNASGSPYLGHAAVVGAVESLLGPLSGFERNPGSQGEGFQAVNLDALMVLDRLGSSDEFDADPTNGEADAVLFSIEAMFSTADPSGYYATGSELILLDATGTASFLSHGGHLWDKAYALGALRVPDAIGTEGIVIDINGIAGIGAAPIPEPAAFGLLGMGFAAMVAMRRRLG